MSGKKAPRRPGIPLAERIGQAPESIEEARSALSLVDAAAKVGLQPGTLREAIRKGELKAFIPRGRNPLSAGPRHGYRITLGELERWYLGGST